MNAENEKERVGEITTIEFQFQSPALIVQVMNQKYHIDECVQWHA